MPISASPVPSTCAGVGIRAGRSKDRSSLSLDSAPPGTRKPRLPVWQPSPKWPGPGGATDACSACGSARWKPSSSRSSREGRPQSRHPLMLGQPASKAAAILRESSGPKRAFPGFGFPRRPNEKRNQGAGAQRSCAVNSVIAVNLSTRRHIEPDNRCSALFANPLRSTHAQTQSFALRLLTNRSA